MSLVQLGGFFSRILTRSSLCRLQEVSASHSVALFPCSDKALPLPSPASECLQFGHVFVCFDKSLPLPSAGSKYTHSVDCFLGADKSLFLPSPVGERTSHCRFLNLS